MIVIVLGPHFKPKSYDSLVISAFCDYLSKSGQKVFVFPAMGFEGDAVMSKWLLTNEIIISEEDDYVLFHYSNNSGFNRDLWFNIRSVKRGFFITNLPNLGNKYNKDFSQFLNIANTGNVPIIAYNSGLPFKLYGLNAKLIAGGILGTYIFDLGKDIFDYPAKPNFHEIYLIANFADHQVLRNMHFNDDICLVNVPLEFLSFFDILSYANACKSLHIIDDHFLGFQERSILQQYMNVHFRPVADWEITYDKLDSEKINADLFACGNIFYSYPPAERNAMETLSQAILDFRKQNHDEVLLFIGPDGANQAILMMDYFPADLNKYYIVMDEKQLARNNVTALLNGRATIDTNLGFLDSIDRPTLISYSDRNTGRLDELIKSSENNTLFLSSGKVGPELEILLNIKDIKWLAVK